jgi:hypothetical protein
MSKRTAKPVPVKPTKPVEPELSAADKALAYATAFLLADGFAWSEHPWGTSFWTDVHEELMRMSEVE